MLTTLSTLPHPLDFQDMVMFKDTDKRLESLAGQPFQEGLDELGAFRMWLFKHDDVPFIVARYLDMSEPHRDFMLSLDPSQTPCPGERVNDVLEALGVLPNAILWRNPEWLHQSPYPSEAV